ncbi:MAG TPA: YigZ family protein [Ferruginibacter sp.]|nr:YigZ family protein [Ferruginibacter sp.]HPH92922.1 YigZ family protein [Ferruginibacter sp.]
MSKEDLKDDKTVYYTIDKPGVAEFKDRGSKFIAFAYPIGHVDDFKKHLQELKKLHPKAVHHCFAYRIGTDGNNFRVSDDGEPSGTAGRPILGQIDSKQVTNAAVIVVRYFGGTLLGVPGLINAYKTVASLALQVTPVVQKQVEVNFTIQFDYTRMNEVMTVLKQHNCTIISQEMQLFCSILSGIPCNRQQEVLYKLKEIPGVNITKS